MIELRVLRMGVVVWAAIAAGVAIPAIAGATADALPLIATASVVGPLCAVAAFVMLGRGGYRRSGALLLLSVATPTYFAWPLNVPALLVGMVLLMAPLVLIRSHSGPSASLPAHDDRGRSPCGGSVTRRDRNRSYVLASRPSDRS